MICGNLKKLLANQIFLKKQNFGVKTIKININNFTRNKRKEELSLNLMKKDERKCAKHAEPIESVPSAGEKVFGNLVINVLMIIGTIM